MPREITLLSPVEEKSYRNWLSVSQITDADKPDSYYDYRGLFKELAGKPVPLTDNRHFPDTYKQHGHPTFSIESKYSKGPNDGGNWNGDTYMPQKQNGLPSSFKPANEETDDRELPPTFIPTKQQGKDFLGNIWDTVNKPIVNLMTPELKKASDELAQPGLEDSRISAMMKGFISGAGEAGTNLLSSSSSPLSLALEAGTGGASIAAGKGLTNLDKMFQMPAKVLAGGTAGHGLLKVSEGLTNENGINWGDVGAGSVEGALGIAGLRGHQKNLLPEKLPTPEGLNTPEELINFGKKELGMGDEEAHIFSLGELQNRKDLAASKIRDAGELTPKIIPTKEISDEQTPIGLDTETRGKVMSDAVFHNWSVEKTQAKLNEATKSARLAAGVNTDTGLPLSPVEKMRAAITGAESTRREQNLLNTAEKAKRIQAAEKTTSKEGLDWAHAHLGAQKGPMPKANFEPVKLDDKDVTSLFNQIRDTDKVNSFEKNRVITGLQKVLQGGTVPQDNELAAMSRVFGDDLVNDLLTKRGKGDKIPGMLANTANFTKTMMSSMDLSAPLRQGKGLIHRKEYWQAFPEMFKSGASEENFKGFLESIRQKPSFELGQRSGLAITDLKSLSSREEAFIGGQWAEKIPGVRASERAYTAFLDKLRADTFESLVNNAKAMGRDPNSDLVLAKGIADYVNTSTGRGSLGALEKHALTLNAALFSPRFVASRMQILNPMYYYKADPFVRKEALKTLIALSATSATVSALGKMAGGEVDSNPTSSDFGKIKIGNVRLDPHAGFQQYIVAASRLIGNESTSSTTGKTTELGKRFGSPTRLDVLGRFAESKASPLVSFATTMLRGKDFTGQPANVMKEIGQRAFPLYIQDMYEVAKENPELAAALAIPAGLGMGVQTYGRK